MAPNPRGIPSPRSQKVRRYNELTIVGKTNPLNHPLPSILTPPSNLPKFKAGRPIFNNSFEIFRQEVIKAQTRKLFDPKIDVKSLQSLTLNESFKLNANYNFYLRGYLEGNGTIFTEEFRYTAKNLYLVGWLKARKHFAIGQLQGDYRSMIYMKRWMELETIKGSNIKNISFSNQNYGFEKYDFLNLTIIRDYRAENQRGRHEVEQFNNFKTQRLKIEAQIRQNEFDEFYQNNMKKSFRSL